MYPEGENAVESDYEGLLEANPEVIIYHAGLNAVRDGEDPVKPLRQDPVASEVRAVKNDRVYPWHEFEQGPIINQFQTEVIAKSLYPEEFGEPTGMEAPSKDRQLFDRQRVADIVNGNV